MAKIYAHISKLFHQYGSRRRMAHLALPAVVGGILKWSVVADRAPQQQPPPPKGKREVILLDGGVGGAV